MIQSMDIEFKKLHLDWFQVFGSILLNLEFQGKQLSTQLNSILQQIKSKMLNYFLALLFLNTIIFYFTYPQISFVELIKFGICHQRNGQN